MKIKEIYNHWFPPKLGAFAVTIINRIYYDCPKEKVHSYTRNHEMEHIKQIQKLGAFQFYFQYLMQYLKGRRNGKDHWTAYEDISFEVEARAAERPAR